MNNTKTFISYHIATNQEILHSCQPGESFKTYSEAKQGITNKLNQIANNSTMSEDNKAYWTEKYTNAVIVESVCTYTVV